MPEKRKGAIEKITEPQKLRKEGTLRRGGENCPVQLRNQVMQFSEMINHPRLGEEEVLGECKGQKTK